MLFEDFLSDYFVGLGAKRLSAVEVDKEKSNQHEFNGVSSLKRLFGEQKRTYDGLLVWLGVNEEDNKSEKISLTWYDARENHATRTEFRLYFQSSEIFENVSENDLLIIGKKTDNTLLVIVAKENSTFESQMIWLFGLTSIQQNRYEIQIIEQKEQFQIDYIKNTILPLLQIEIDLYDENLLDLMIDKFNESFPSTREFSSFANSTLKNLNFIESPDDVLIQLMEKEEILFKTLEKYFVEKKLKSGFGKSGIDVDDFINFSLSVQNRRKSRVGFALENHLEEIFIKNNIQYERGKITENKSRPDFIFPSIDKYHDISFSNNLLTMLGAKSTCKDRWRQVLTEARKISIKHLLTLEPAISQNQTDEMQSNNLQLVVPSSIIKTYNAKQQEWLINLKDFVNIIKEKEKKIS